LTLWLVTTILAHNYSSQLDWGLSATQGRGVAGELRPRGSEISGMNEGFPFFCASLTCGYRQTLGDGLEATRRSATPRPRGPGIWGINGRFSSVWGTATLRIQSTALLDSCSLPSASSRCFKLHSPNRIGMGSSWHSGATPTAILGLGGSQGFAWLAQPPY